MPNKKPKIVKKTSRTKVNKTDFYTTATKHSFSIHDEIENHRRATASKPEEDETPSLEARITQVLSSGQHTVVVPHNPFSLLWFIVALVLLILLAAGSVFAIKALKNLPAKPQSTQSATIPSNNRTVDWNSFQSEVQKKRIEADLKFEELKKQTQTTSSSNNNSPTTPSSGLNMSSEIQTLSDLSTFNNNLDSSSLTLPTLYSF